MKDRKCILFDLDGTLSDSGEGIINSLTQAMQELGIAADRQLLRTFIGPPLKESFSQNFDFSEEQVEEAIRVYRRHYDQVGFFQNELYPESWNCSRICARLARRWL